MLKAYPMGPSISCLCLFLLLYLFIYPSSPFINPSNPPSEDKGLRSLRYIISFSFISSQLYCLFWCSLTLFFVGDLSTSSPPLSVGYTLSSLSPPLSPFNRSCDERDRANCGGTREQGHSQSHKSEKENFRCLQKNGLLQ